MKNMSKKMEVILERMKTLNNDELKRLANEVDAEIFFRDDDRRICKVETKDVWDNEDV